jgi:hypothetical protein
MHEQEESWKGRKSWIAESVFVDYQHRSSVNFQRSINHRKSSNSSL